MNENRDKLFIFTVQYYLSIKSSPMWIFDLDCFTVIFTFHKNIFFTHFTSPEGLLL